MCICKTYIYVIIDTRVFSMPVSTASSAERTRREDHFFFRVLSGFDLLSLHCALEFCNAMHRAAVASQLAQLVAPVVLVEFFFSFFHFVSILFTILWAARCVAILPDYSFLYFDANFLFAAVFFFFFHFNIGSLQWRFDKCSLLFRSLCST